jgi:hypothetical protein
MVFSAIVLFERLSGAEMSSWVSTGCRWPRIMVLMSWGYLPHAWGSIVGLDPQTHRSGQCYLSPRDLKSERNATNGANAITMIH